MIRRAQRLLVAVLLASSVGGTAWGEPEPESVPALDPAMNTSVSPSEEGLQRFEVILSRERLDAVWPEVSGATPALSLAPAIDLDAGNVVVYSTGAQPNECYAAEIGAVRSQYGAFLVEVNETEPAPNCVCTFAAVEPSQVVRLDRGQGPVTLCVRRPQLGC